MTTNCHHAALILLGKATIDDVPESQQTSVMWLVKRCGPDGVATDPESVVIGLMRKIERLRRE